MKNRLLLIIFSVAIFSACDSMPSPLEKQASPLPPNKSVSNTEVIPFKLSVDDAKTEFSKRTWVVSNNELNILADLTGDGKLDSLDVSFVESTDGEVSLGADKNLLTVSWPFDKIENVFIGDIDRDGDADILLSEENRYVLFNRSSKHERDPVGDAELSASIKEIQDLIAANETHEAFISALSIGLSTPHSWTAGGEGSDGRFDRDLEYDLNVGNCVTWVEQVLAIMNAGGTVEGFRKHLLNIRYLDGEKDYALRNHFQESDWIPNNIAAGYIEDILSEMLNDSVPEVAATTNKKNWYSIKNELEGNFSELSQNEFDERINELQNLGAFMPEQKVTLGYYPFDKIVAENEGNVGVNPNFYEKLPDVTIFNLVNSGLTIKDKEGNWATDLIVSHTGFLVKGIDGKVIVYHSTPMTDTGLSEMTEEDLVSFLSRRFLHNDKTKAVGLNLTKPLIKN